MCAHSTHILSREGETLQQLQPPSLSILFNKESFHFLPNTYVQTYVSLYQAAVNRQTIELEW